jgi:N-methylhydantoinase B
VTDARTAPALDAVTTEVIRHALETIVEEMRVSLRRTAYSVVVKDLLDFSCGLFDVRGRLLGASVDIPSLLASMSPALTAALDRWDGEIAPGDVLLTNHPYMGNAHTNDVNIFIPVYDEAGRQLGFAGTVCHHADWGGRVPGTAAASNRSVFEEGVMYPAIKLEEAGRPNRSVYEILWANVRHPTQNQGDLRAQVAAARTGERRLVRLAERYGSELLLHTGDALLAHSERRTRDAIAEMPDGTYEAEGYLDDDGLTPDVPVRIHVRVVIAGEHMRVDFEGSSPQIDGGGNCPLATTRSVVHYGVKCLVPADIPFNEGSVAPIEIVAPPGSIVNPAFPAAVGDRHHTAQRMADVLGQALSQAVPARGSAGWFSGTPAIIIEAPSNTTGEMSVLLSILGGGTGAMDGADGASALDAHMSNCALIPAEVIESVYPLRVECCSLVPDSGGAGRWRGGLGLRVDLRVLGSDPLSVRVETEQAVALTAAPGLEGGRPGTAADVRLDDAGRTTPLPAKGTTVVKPGQIVSVRSGGGGGYGDPALRDVSSIERDRRAGFAT